MYVPVLSEVCGVIAIVSKTCFLSLLITLFLPNKCVKYLSNFFKNNKKCAKLYGRLIGVGLVIFIIEMISRLIF